MWWWANIHLCPSFFAAGTTQADVILHEMGRFFLVSRKKHGNGTTSTYGIPVGSLCRNANAILRSS